MHMYTESHCKTISHYAGSQMKKPETEGNILLPTGYAFSL